MLIPMDNCPGDLNYDGVVDVSDLLALLAAWGPAGDCSLIDLNGDGVVDVSDLLILLANWGPCPWSNETVLTLEEVMTQAGLSMDGWSAFVTVMTGSSSQSEKENWNCWMQRYISGCQLCPGCPSSDPLRSYQLD